MIVYRPELEQEAEYFLSIMNDNRNQLNPLLPAPGRCELNEYLKKRRKIESQNIHIIMLGDSDEAKKLYKNANRGRWDYYKFGIGAFSDIYVDLCSGHSPIFKIGDEKDRCDDFRCIPYISSSMSGLNPDDWLCLFRNYLMFAEITGGMCCRLDYEEDTKKDGVSYDSATKTVATGASPVTLPDIVHLIAIDPIPFAKRTIQKKMR